MYIGYMSIENPLQNEVWIGGGLLKEVVYRREKRIFHFKRFI